jgi:hypothetical protein
MLDPVVKVAGARDEGAIDEKELALQPVRQRPAHGRLARARRTVEQHAALGTQLELTGERIILQRRFWHATGPGAPHL